MRMTSASWERTWKESGWAKIVRIAAATICRTLPLGGTGWCACRCYSRTLTEHLLAPF